MSLAPPDVDATQHYQSSKKDVLRLWTVIIDTNPQAWDALADTLPLEHAVASILLLLNSHISHAGDNEVAIIASHSSCAQWLYPAPTTPSPDSTDEDVQMTDDTSKEPGDQRSIPSRSWEYAQVETAVLSSLRKLLNATTIEDMRSSNTHISGAITLALAYSNRLKLKLTTIGDDDQEVDGGAALVSRILIVSVATASPSQYISVMNTIFAAAHNKVVIDVLDLRGAVDSSAAITDSESASASVAGPNESLPSTAEHTFLQVAADLTSGIYVPIRSRAAAAGFVSYLMACFPEETQMDLFVPPSQESVDFRAACFCHSRIVSTGFVCSICLSIFCCVPGTAPPSADSNKANSNGNSNSIQTDGGSQPMDGVEMSSTTANVPSIRINGASATVASDVALSVECPTCASQLRVGSYGKPPAVVPKKKRKRKNGTISNGTATEAGTPAAPGTPVTSTL